MSPTPGFSLSRVPYRSRVSTSHRNRLGTDKLLTERQSLGLQLTQDAQENTASMLKSGWASLEYIDFKNSRTEL